jgi:hypothetical protein
MKFSTVDACYRTEEGQESENELARYTIAQANQANHLGFLSFVRILSLIIILVIDRYNRRRLQKDTSNNKIAVVLPIYYDILNAFIIWTVIICILNMSSRKVSESHVTIGVALSLFHTLMQGVAMLLMQPGAGKRDFRRSITCGICFGLYCGLTFIVAEVVNKGEASLIIYLVFNVSLCVFYFLILVAPSKRLYRRPAIYPFAIFHILYNVVWAIANVVTYFGYRGHLCYDYVVYLLFDGILVPLVLYFTLAADSLVTQL